MISSILYTAVATDRHRSTNHHYQNLDDLKAEPAIDLDINHRHHFGGGGECAMSWESFLLYSRSTLQSSPGIGTSFVTFEQ